jgi:hypothetical protein
MSSRRSSLALLVVLATSVQGQRTQLELRPRMGDTLRLRLDQITELSGSRQGTLTKQVVTTMRMFSRAIVEESAPTSTLILAVTDSVEVSSTDERAQSLAANTERQLRGRQMRLRLAPDGTVSVAGQSGDVSREVNDLVSVMPASFPRAPVAVGESWLREMPIASGAAFGMPPGGIVVRATFHLDSLARGGDLAFITMRGTLDQAVLGVASLLNGTVSGTMTVNRKRGWLSESRFMVDLRTTVPSRSATTASPMQFRTRITQHMRIVDKREHR